MSGNVLNDPVLDTADYTLLHLLQSAERPLWKTEIHARFTDDSVRLPGPETLSLQSVGRRINELHGEGYLTSKIVSPPSLSQDLIIAYMLTSKGVDAMEQAQDRLLRDYAFRFDEPIDDEDKSVLIALLLASTDAPEDLCRFMESECSPAETSAIAALYYVHNFLETQLSDERRERLMELLDLTDDMEDFRTFFTK